MTVIDVDASKFSGMSEEQARTFPRRTVVGEKLSESELAEMPKMKPSLHLWHMEQVPLLRFS